MSSPPRLGRALSAVLIVGTISLASGCGKSLTISDSGAQTSTAPPQALSAPEPSPSAAPAPPGNDALQVVDKTAAQDGKTGNGGTLIGITVEEKPPKWQQISAVSSAPLYAPHLINVNQSALYRFDNDATSKSNCYDMCAQKWPPATVQEKGNVYLAGVEPDEVGAIRRADGNIQITVNGSPIYRFSGDSKPGDLNGQGIDGKWFAVGPQGEKVTGKN